jgi:hypothetical protein
MRSILRSLSLALLLLVARQASAAELLHGQYQFPGKLQLGVRPIGGQVWLVGTNPVFSIGDYKFGIDFSGKLLEMPKLTLWLGGEFNLGGQGSLAQIEPGIFVMITLEKLLNIPLVPHVMGGISFPINVFYGPTYSYTVGGFGVKVGGGAYYYLIKQIGLGGDMHFNFAGGFGGPSGGPVGCFGCGWLGYWDILLGARFSF